MQRDDVSRHEVLVYSVLESNRARWMSNRDIAAAVHGVAERTIRHHTRRLAEGGVIEQMQIFPGHRYRLAVAPNQDYVQRLRKAATILGVQMTNGDA